MKTRKLNKYLFRGHEIQATSKDAILRRFRLKNNTETQKLITIVKQEKK